MNLVVLNLLIALVAGEINQCIQDLTKIKSNLFNFTRSDPYSLMASYSGRGLSDLGDYENCANLDYADYILLRIFPKAPVFIGVCSSKNCRYQISTLSLLYYTQITPLLSISSFKIQPI